MTAPTDYFRRCDADTPGAQRIGFEWFVFTDQDALSRALQDGMFDPADTTLAEQLEDAESKLEDLEEEIEKLEAEVQKLKEELEEERA